MILAPVILFVYNRFDHTKDTLEALMKNTLAIESDLYIFSDGPKNQQAVEMVNKVREYIKSDDIKAAFKSVSVIESPHNKGLAKSIISGVNEVINNYGKVIVVEDDSVSSKDFLEYMNNGLEYYRTNKNIWSIGGYSFPMQFPKDYQFDIFVMGRTCSYAWATWKDRWEKIDWNVSDYNKFKYDLVKRKLFNRYGNDRSHMLDGQMNGKIDSWAIRFCYAMFSNNMLTVYPRYSKVRNIGHDGTGTHAKKVSNKFDTILLEGNVTFNDLVVDERIRKQFVSKFEMNLYSRIKMFIKYIILNKVFFRDSVKR
ncbi:sugar transferase [Pseudoneobacillus sp. C159]